MKTIHVGIYSSTLTINIPNTATAFIINTWELSGAITDLCSPLISIQTQFYCTQGDSSHTPGRASCKVPNSPDTVMYHNVPSA